MKLPKLKIYLKLVTVLWAIFFLVVLAEAFVLYRYVYRSFRQEAVPVVDTASADNVHIDLPAARDAEKWLEAKRNYQIPDYSLNTSTSGRSNPFAEY